MLIPVAVIGVVVALAAWCYVEGSGKSINYVLFDGQTQLPGLVQQAGA